MSDLTSAGVARSGFSRISARLADNILTIYTLTIFLSALLLFAVQPMFTKMVTPTLGGTPAVWSVAMVFFQAVLLAGYTYAHALNRYFDLRTAAGLHVTLMIVVTAVGLPIAFDPAWGRPADGATSLWLIAVFTASVGLPFFAVSANGPLLQSWFARSGHAQAADPYFLYGASNLGSFLALLAYPFVIEPGLSLKLQSWVWGGGFMVLVLAIATAALALVLRATPSALARTESKSDADAAPIGATDRWYWIAMAFVPSALLVAVTAHMSTEIAAVPLLWVVPLALYLLTFVVAFSSAGERWHRKFVSLMAPALAILLMTQAMPRLYPLVVMLIVHLAFFFVAVMVCHGEVYRRRPAASKLTQFYFFLSLGGVLGGIFSSLAAPLVFNAVFEYPVMIVAAALCVPGVWQAMSQFGWKRLTSILAAAVVVLIVMRLALSDTILISAAFLAVFAASILMVIRQRSPLAFAACALLGVTALQAAQSTSDIVLRTRSFFAVHSVKNSADGRARLLTHGNTVHGAEFQRDASGQPLTSRPEPASYFYRGGPFSQAIDGVRSARGGTLGRVAVIGLGMGSLACHAKPGEAWEFFEIDPEVVRIARDPKLFRSFSACAPGAPVVIGDGRLTLADAKAGYDIIVIDAFSSATVPVHMLTTEALAIYRSKLTEGGAIVFNITNRHMRLDEVVAGAAQANGLTAFHRHDDNPAATFATLRTLAHVAVAMRRPEDVPAISGDANWKAATLPAGAKAWSDDYSNIIAPIRRKLGW